MAINITRYVDINSVIGAGAGVATRNLGARFFTENPLVPTDSFVSFTNAADVGTYFGTSSVEYLRAVFYFGWTSKTNTAPNLISFARFVNQNVPAEFLGAPGSYSYSSFTSVTTGDFTLTLGGITHHLTSLDFSSVTSLDNVATVIQIAINAYSAGGAAWTAATVVYDTARTSFDIISGVSGADTIVVAAGVTTDIATLTGWLTGSNAISGAVPSTIYGAVGNYTTSQFTAITTGDFTLTLGGYTSHITGIDFSAASALSDIATDIQTKIRAVSAGGVDWTAASVTYNSTRKSFDLVSGLPENDTITLLPGTTTDVLAPLGWGTGAILSNGSIPQSITSTLTASTQASNNFGSFGFVSILTLAQVTEAATWNHTQNVMFIYSVPVTAANASSWSAALLAIGGTTMTLAPLTSEYPEQVPMMILAATNYSGTNTVQNYMFQQFNLTPSVTTDTDANTYDALLINYYGQTQTAGQLLSFYQRGVMFGIATDPSDQNVYSNEIWLKDAFTASIMGLLLSVTQLPANAQGRANLLVVLQAIINQAVLNGTISIGKLLSPVQQTYITTITGSTNAWQQVQNSGYWVNVAIEPFVVDSVTQYKAVYTLIYSKNDVIRLVQGSDILI